MGFFGEKRSLDVETSIRNLAGPEEGRAKFLQTVILSSILRGKESLGAEIRDAYLRGPGMKIRRFLKWANADDARIPVPIGSLAGAPSVNNEIVRSYLPPDSRIEKIELDSANPAYFAERYMLENHPNEALSAWSYSMENGEITITFEDTTTVSFVPLDYSPSQVYLYVTYTYGYAENQSAPLIWIYPFGTGYEDLDAELQGSADDPGEFYPAMPLKFQGNFVDDFPNQVSYNMSKKALKYGLALEADDILEALKDHESSEEIDHATVILGVSANNKSPSAKKYMYDFLKRLKLSQVVGISDYETYIASRQTYTNYVDSFEEWKTTYQEAPPDPDQTGNEDPPPDPPPPPAHVDNPSVPKNSLRIRSGSRSVYSTSIDMEISWVSIEEEFGTGLAKAGAKNGEYWFEDLGSDIYENSVETLGLSLAATDTVINIVSLTNQIDENSWRRLKITGMVHKSLIMKDAFIETKLSEAIQESDEESPFVFLLHSPTFRAMSIKDATELSISCALLAIDAYVYVAPGPFNNLFLRIWFSAIIVIIAVGTGGIGAGSLGVLGTNLAVGTAIGLTGAAAVIAGAVANMLAAVIITEIITMGAQAVLGDEIGLIVGTLASFLTLNAVANFSQTGQFAINFASLARVDNIISLTGALGNAAGSVIAANTQRFLEDSRELWESYEEESAMISELYAENIGYGNMVFDPALLTDSGITNIERPETFLDRTLMCGSDIAQLSVEMVSNFTDISLSNKLPI